MKTRLLVGILFIQLFAVFSHAHFSRSHLKNERRVNDIECLINYTVEEKGDTQERYKTYPVEGKDIERVPVIVKQPVRFGDDYEEWEEVTDLSEYSWPGDFHAPGTYRHHSYLSNLCVANADVALKKLLKDKIDVATSEVTLCAKIGPKENDVSCKCVGFILRPYVRYGRHDWPSAFDFDDLSPTVPSIRHAVSGALGGMF